MHVAIIMDGNGRWAARRRLPRTAGHRAGAKAVDAVVAAAARRRIDTLTLYAFSAANWQRPAAEVDALMTLFRRYLVSQTPRCIEQSIRVNVIGRRDRLGAELCEAIARSEHATAQGSGMCLRIAVDYSAQYSLVEMCRRARSPRDFDRPQFLQQLGEIDHAVLPIAEVDLLIRTGGERRLSDFLLWECAYAELHFVDCMWPDFDESAFDAALRDYQQRERRLVRSVKSRRRPCMRSSQQLSSRAPKIPRDMAIAPVLPPVRSGLIPQKHHALLVNPFYSKDPRASYGKHVLTPTLALTSIAGATPTHWEVRYWDENLLQGPPPLAPMPQVVGISVHLTFARRAYELAAWFRAHGALVVLGGLHVLSCPEEAAEHADAIAIGDGVQLWPQILGDVEAGMLRRRYEADYARSYALDPAPRRAILPRASFLTTTSVIATRGCHNRCGFCYLATEGLHMPYRMRAVEQVTAEIAGDGQPYVVFVDNNLGSRPAYLRKLCEALRPLGIIWSAAVTIDVTDDPALVREMARAGCTGVFVGFESLNGGNLTDARKRTPAPEDYARRVALLHRYGIQVNGSFVLGFDHDGPDVFARTVEWIEDNRLECATFHILTPYPGTPLFRQLETEGRILHRDWDKYDTAHVVFQPKHMSVEELDAGYAWCYERLFSHRSIWRRRPEDRSAVLAYLAMSYLYKRSNRFWHLLIKHRLTAAVWRPLIEHSRQRHLKFRTRLEDEAGAAGRASHCVSAGV